MQQWKGPYISILEEQLGWVLEVEIGWLPSYK
jgi:hypothetical protein